MTKHSQTPPSPESLQTDQRSSPRLPFQASIDVRIPNGDLCRGIARDLSPNGMGAIVFADATDLKVGDSVVISYTHPRPSGTEAVERAARVSGQHGNRYVFVFEQPMDVG